MNFRLGAATIVAAAITLCACASPQTARPVVDASTLADEQHRQSIYVLESRATDYRRVYDIANRLSRANAELCARQTQTIGVRFENLNDYGRDFREAARSLWGLDNTPTVNWVAEDSPASHAGIRVNDRIVAINGRAIPTNRNASRQAVRWLRDAAEDGNVTLQLRRGIESVVVNVTPRSDCAYQFYMSDDDAINAMADGQSIYITRGMLRFVRTDEELALVLGHELAHNAMRHIESAQQNATMGMAGGLLLDVLAAGAGVNTGGAFTDAGGDIGRMMFAQEFESEADYVGMYFMARAGYNIDGVENFWRRMSAESPRSIRLAYTHPNNAERFLVLAATRQEILRKQNSNLPLRPNMEGEHAAPEPITEAITPTPAPPVSETPVAIAPGTP